MPRAYIEMILSSKPVNRLCPLATILGSKLPCRSRGVSSSSSPKSPFSTLRPLPLRLFPLCCPAGSCFSYPRWSVSSACSARSRIAFVSCFSRPFSPMMSSGFLYPASIWSISALSIAIGADSPLPMVGYTVPYTAPLDVVLHPFHDYDGIINHQPYSQHQAEHRKRVDRETEQREDGERPHQRDRHSQHWNQGGAPVLQEEVDHKNDEHNRNHQGLEDLFHAFCDRERLVE